LAQQEPIQCSPLTTIASGQGKQGIHSFAVSATRKGKGSCRQNNKHKQTNKAQPTSETATNKQMEEAAEKLD